MRSEFKLIILIALTQPIFTQSLAKTSTFLAKKNSNRQLQDSPPTDRFITVTKNAFFEDDKSDEDSASARLAKQAMLQRKYAVQSILNRDCEERCLFERSSSQGKKFLIKRLF